jgi:hypothetical protein
MLQYLVSVARKSHAPHRDKSQSAAAARLCVYLQLARMSLPPRAFDPALHDAEKRIGQTVGDVLDDKGGIEMRNVSSGMPTEVLGKRGAACCIFIGIDIIAALGCGAPRRSQAEHSQRSRESHRVWQREYWDRFVRNDHHDKAIMSYINMNPV